MFKFKLKHVIIYFQLVGSAPGFPHGVIDSLEEIAAVSYNYLTLNMLGKKFSRPF